MADLSIATSFVPDPPTVGATAQVTNLLTNNDTTPETGVVVQDQLSSSIVPTSIDNGGVYDAASRTVTWGAGTVAGSSSQSFSFQFTVSSPNTMTVEGDISLSTADDPDLSNNTSTTSTTPVCFVAGTMILTARGEVPVEELAVGDFVVTASGAARPVTWLGHRTLDCRAAADPRAVWPVRIAAGAIGPGRPSRDLLVSPGHALGLTCVDEVLVPAGRLINGATIMQVRPEEVTYWHVELDSHDLLVANGLPAESYRAVGNRLFFAEAIEAGLQVADVTRTEACRPFIADGAVIHALRERIAARARQLGWTPSMDPDLRLVVDGTAVRPVEAGEAALFLFSARATSVRLVSGTFVPADLGQGDNRTLGLAIQGLVLSATHGEPRRVAVDDGRLQGFHHPEEWRWTTGELSLDPSLWEGLSGEIALLVTCDRKTVRGWTLASVAADALTDRPRLYAVQ